jgi:MFS family permease
MRRVSHAAQPDPTRFALLRDPRYGPYVAAVFLSGLAAQVQTVAVGWEVYDITRNPFDLGLVGLSQFAPALLLVLVTGVVADRFSRRRIMAICLALEAVAAAALLALSLAGNLNVVPIFAVLVAFGTARAFYNPARQALVPNLVSKADLPRAVALNSTANQTAMICGPVAGGLLYGIAPVVAYGSVLVLLAAAALCILRIPRPPQRTASQRASWDTLVAGFRYIRGNPVLLGAISLDLFAVLLGGATALLPVYARDILDVGPVGLGLLRAAPAVGAITVAVLLLTRPVPRPAGRSMFLAVAGFGVFTLVFALSETVWISVLALALTGAFDMISVVIRFSLIQLNTPDELRGRVNAVNQVFIGASNEVGAFRAGTTATVIGPVAAVALGAVGTLAVAGLWARWFPALRRIDRL